MFWALATGRLFPEAWGFEGVQFRTADTETLNRWAAEGAADVVAVSIAHVPALAGRYLLLPHGGSVGRGYGPVVVSRRAGRPATVGIPGERTTAARLVAAALPEAKRVVVPFHESLAAIDRGDVEAAVLIHEGRLVYRKLGFELIMDLGVWWRETTGLPLPLGGNVIRADLGEERIAQASAMLRESIAYALAHRDEAIEELLRGKAMSWADADEYLRLYANDDTLDYGADGRAAVERLIGAGVSWA